MMRNCHLFIVAAFMGTTVRAFNQAGCLSTYLHSQTLLQRSWRYLRHAFPSKYQLNNHVRWRVRPPILASATAEKLTAQTSEKLIRGVDVFIFDCDGVIWKGDSLISGVHSTLERLRAAGKKVFFVTNNSSKSRRGYKAKFDSLGLNVIPEEIFSSSFAVSVYLENIGFKQTGKRVYIIGERGIQEELDIIGVPWIGGEDHMDKKIELKPGSFFIFAITEANFSELSGFALEHDRGVGAVIVGFDRNINYYKIQYAQLCINENKDCQFIATNLDQVTHLTDAQEWAGNGCMVGAVKGCTGRDPIVVGKPAPLMIEYICKKYDLQPGQICMVHISY
mmetsp:Transcript_42455/g.113590  ORF Transcript_42455/g.113590 Transcript_42455/m.113590 type:complete len:335 (-) Transcript_42455:174-1178(-)